MKIINSHYIPMPEPRWLIMENHGYVYEQLGTLNVVEESEEAPFGIKTHGLPVVKDAMGENYSDYIGNNIATLAPADGMVLDDIDLNNCFLLCPSNNRVLLHSSFNLLAMKYMTDATYDEFNLAATIKELQVCQIKLDFPEEDEQEVALYVYFIGNNVYLHSGKEGFFFFVRSGHTEGTMVKTDKQGMLMEFVNQVRAYMIVNPNYKFHFTTNIDKIRTLVEYVNNEIEDYLDRDDESE